jgi:hypothetical protein
MFTQKVLNFCENFTQGKIVKFLVCYTAEQYLAYKLIDSNQDWKSRWFYITNHNPKLPKPSGKQLKHQPWWNSELIMQEGIQLTELLAKIKALREAGLRAEHVAFSFLKRRV